MFLTPCRIAISTGGVKRRILLLDETRRHRPASQESRMSLPARIGITLVALLVLTIIFAGLYAWKRPLSVYAAINRHALRSAGLTQASAPTAFGPQNYWVGGQGQTLVLLHGAGDQASTWSAVAAALVPRYRVVIPDLAGHGRSAPAEGPISLTQVLRGVEAVLTQGSQDPAIIVGNSLGAWVALLYAREHPDRVSRIVLVNGGALTGDRPDLSLMPRTRTEAAALWSQLRDPKSGNIPGFMLDDVVREGQTGPIARLAQTASEMASLVLDGKLHEIAAPVDLIWGASDRLFSLAYADRMKHELRASRLTTLQACGHVPHVECPTRFQAALVDVLQQAPPLPRAGGK
jgi:abhydrolase domain-containing protein 6